VIHSLGFNNYKLSHDAYNVFRDFQFWIHEYKEQPDESFGYGMMTTLGKLEGIASINISDLSRSLVMPSFLKTLTLDRFKSLSVIVSYLSDFIKICSVFQQILLTELLISLKHY
jgi:hypothetical protein